MPDPLNMASSGKKSKKPKGKTISLNSFLQETPGAIPSIPLRKASSNWADEVEDTYDNYDGGRSSARPTNLVLPTAPKAARGLDDFSDKIPQQPPFNVYLSNLPYDVEDDEIADFFGNLKIVNMRIPREDRTFEGGRVRGFGYVEFEDQASLIEALEMPNCILKGRRIRIEIATNSDNEKRRGRMDMNRERSDRPEAPTGDWRSGARKEPDLPERRYRDGGGRDFNRGDDRSSGMWRDNTDRPSFKDRDSNENRFREDKPITREAPPTQFESNERRGGFGARREREDRSNGGGFRREERVSTDDPQRQRPKLNLAPRTLPTATENIDKEKESEEVTRPTTSAAIFGAAKPVDTTAREREIEERLAKQSEVMETRNEGRRRSPERRRYSPPRKESQERRRDVSPTDQRRDDNQKRNERNSSRENKERMERKPMREHVEKEMPKIKTPEPINIVGPNKYAFLETDGDEED